MASYSFASLQFFNVLPFNPLADKIDFTGSGVTAADFNFEVDDDGGEGTITFFVEGKLVTLVVDPLRLSAGSFLGSGLALIGDNSSAIREDDLANVLQGSSGNDLFVGLGGNDSAVGGAGDDVFYTFRGRSGSIGNDTLEGGLGTDRLSISDLEGRYFNIQEATLGGGTIFNEAGFDLAGNVTVNLTTGSATLPDFDGTNFITSTLKLSGIENVSGSEAPDNITGGAEANLLFGGYGNDTLTGNGGNDTLIGGTERDLLSGGDGDDLLRGQGGADTIQGGAGNDTIRGYGKPGDVMDGGAGIDVLENQYLQTSLLDASNIENLVVLGGVNVLADGGLDSILSGDAPDSKHWDELFDLYVTWAEGNNVANSITGSSGDNFLSGGGGNDTLNGGGGFDIAVYNHDGTAAVVATFDASGAGSGSATVAGGGNVDSLVGIEGLAGGYGNDTITGGAGNELLYGGYGNDSLTGGAGDDTIFGRDGNDFMDGGAGTGDWLALSGTHAGVTVDLSLLTGQVIDGGEDDVDTAINFENLAGGQFDDDLTGNADANIIYGAYGDDILDGGLGNDSLDGGDGFDMVDYRDATGAVTVNLFDETATGAAGSDTLTRIEGVFGSDFNDTIIGGTAPLIADAGKGNDSIVGNSALDAVSYADAEGPVTIDLGEGTATGAYGTDTLSGIDMVIGSEFADTLLGRSVAADEVEILAGNKGDDTITGGGGAGTTIVWFGAADVGVNATMSGGNVSYSGGGLEGEDVITFVDGMWGSGFNDTLVGDAAANELAGFEGNDSLNGGGGADWVMYLDSDDPVFVNLSGSSVTFNTGSFGTLTVAGGTAYDGLDMNPTMSGTQWGLDTLVGIENVAGGSGADNLVGGDDANVLEGGYGNDTLVGGKGNDTLEGGEGPSDQVNYASSTSGVIVNLGTTQLILDDHVVYGDATLDGGTAYDGIDTNGGLTGVQPGIDSLLGIEQVRGTGTGDYLKGADSSGFYTGFMGAATSTMYLLGNNNTGGAITDIDTIDGGSASWADFDQVNYGGLGANGVNVDLRAGEAYTQNAPFSIGPKIATFSNIDGVIGTGGADWLMGGSDSRTFSGAKFETFQGGAGNDTIQGRGGIDWVDVFNPTQSVQIDLSNQNGFGFSGNNDGFGGKDSLQSIDGVRVLGTVSTNDTLQGGDQSDREYFLGGAGDDVIDGGGNFDIAMYTSSTSAVYVNLSLGVAYDGFLKSSGDFIGSNDNLFQIEGVWGSDFDDTLIGSSASGDVWEEFEGRGGADLIDGNDGFVSQVPGVPYLPYDLASYSNATNAVFVNLDDDSRDNGDITLAAGSAADGFGSIDTLIGVEGARGSRFDDTLLGGNAAHDDFEFFEGAAGNDLIDGGTGQDWLFFDFAYAGVSVDLGASTVLDDGWGGVDTLVSIEHSYGSEYDDLLVGSSVANVLSGSGGDDTLRGGAGNDQLIGREHETNEYDRLQSDWADFSDAASALTASLVTGRAQSAETGLDVLANIDHLRGGAGNDMLTGNAGDNWLQGGGGDDMLIGGTGRDVASFAESSANLGIVIGTGTWTATGAGNDTMVGIEGVAGGSGNDTLTGNAFDNFFAGGYGNDSITGGGGFDWMDYSESLAPVTINLATGAAAGQGADTLSGIEGVIGSYAADTFTSSNSTANGTLEFFAPNGGNDTVIGSTNASLLTILSLQGVRGTIDTTVAFAGFGLDLGFNDGSGVLRVEYEYDIGGIDLITYSGIDGAYGTMWNDSMVGNDGDNWFNGGSGADVLIAGDGADGFDTLSYRDAVNPVLANLSGAGLSRTYTLADGTSFGRITVQGAHAVDGNTVESQIWIDAFGGTFERLEGGAYNDTVLGGNVANQFFGHEGDDWLAGGSGDGAGIDTLDGGAGVDRVFFSDPTQLNASGVTVNLQTNKATSLDGEDSLIGVEGAQGTVGNDSFTGRDDYQLHGMFSRELYEIWQPFKGADTINGGGTGWGQLDILQLEGFSSGANLPTSGTNVNLGVNTVTNDGFGTADVLVANTIDFVIGNQLNDTLVGGSTSRSNTGSLFEIFRGQAGADSINGMGGEDRADYAFATAGVVVNLGSTARSLAATPYASLLTLAGGRAIDGHDSVSGTAGTQHSIDILAGIEHVRGSSFQDFLFGGGSHNASATNVDRFYDYEAFEGLEGNDFIDGGAGNDIAVYTRSSSGVIVNLGADPLVVGDYTVASGKAHDGFGTVDTLVNIEVVVGSDFDDYIQGGAGNEQFRAGAGSDTMHGGAGNDRLNYSNSPNGVFVDLAGGTATDGFDSDLLTAGVQAWTDSISGFEAVRGSHGDDTLLGTTGDDTLEGMGGNDSLVGGDGIDTVTYRFEEQHGSSHGVIVNLGVADFIAGPITVQGGHALDGFSTSNGGPSRGLDTLVGFENIGGSSFADTLIGNAGDNIIEGELGNDSIDGGAGNDTATYRNAVGGILVNFATNTVSGGAGNDTLTGIETVEGSAFNDSYIVDSPANIIVELLNQGTDMVTAQDSYTLGANLEILLLAAAAGNIDGTGNEGNNTITGNTGNNILDGGVGNDSLIGGLGNDTYVVDSALDGVVETSVAGAGTADEVRLDGGVFTYTLGANLENLTIVGETGRNVTGNAVGNVFRGGTGRDTFTGGAGNDTYIIDDLENGAHEISGIGLGLANAATINEQVGGGIDTVVTSVNILRPLAPNIENIVLEAGVITATGNDSNNLIIGNNLPNKLIGGKGKDTLQGGGGNDTLIGGDDADSYIIDEGSDTIIENGATSDDFAEQRSTSFDQKKSGQGLDQIKMTGLGDQEFLGNDRNTRISVKDGDTDSQTVRSGAGKDNIFTGGGDDIIEIGDPTSTVNGGDGEDRIQVRFDYTLNVSLEILEFLEPLSGPGNYSGAGNNSANTLIGNSGNNTLDGRGGNDSLDGGGGFDAVSYANETVGVLINLDGGSGVGSTLVGGAGTDILVNIEDAAGGKGNDTIYGDEEGNQLFGLAANDSLFGLAGDDTLEGGAGNDTLVGGAGADSYRVESTLDRVDEDTQTGAIDTVLSTVNFSLASANVIGEVENLVLLGAALSGIGNGLNNSITGNKGNNTLDGGAGNDTLIGGLGNDTYVVNIETDVVTEEANGGIDTVTSSTLLSYTLTDVDVENLTLAGLSTDTAARTLTGNSGNNSLTGGAGADVLNGMEGNDTMNGGGGAGNDLFHVDSQGDVLVDGGGTADTVEGSADFSIASFTFIEVARAAEGTDDIDITGNAASNVISGNDGDNSLSGGAGNDALFGASDLLLNAGNDTLDGGLGNDTMFGGLGNDTYVVDKLEATASAVVFDAIGTDIGGIDTVISSVNISLQNLNDQNRTDLENVVLTGMALIAVGNSLSNTLTGNSGNNELDGRAGIDIMIGGGGNDAYGVDNADDEVIEVNTAAGGNDTIVITAAINYALEEGKGIENLAYNRYLSHASKGDPSYEGGTLTGTSTSNILVGDDGNDSLVGLGGNDALFGDNTATDSDPDGNDTLEGGAGNDSLAGNGGNDWLDGGVGVDTMNGGAGDDTYVIDAALDVVATDTGGNDTVRTSVGATLTLRTDLENAVLLEGAALNVIGNASKNALTGNSNSNFLSGGLENDTLIGGLGNDTLEGGAGIDSLDGGTGGSDWASFAAETLVVQATAGAGTVLIGGVAADVFVDIENLIGGKGNDKLTGDENDNILDGGTGADILAGGGGNDTYVIDVIGDAISDDGGAVDSVRAFLNHTLAADFENLALFGSAATGAGNASANLIEGNAANNTLNGAGGNDTIVGNAGNDVLVGGETGDDFDTADYSGTTTSITLTLGIGSIAVTGGAGNDTLTEFEMVKGGSGSDWAKFTGSGPVEVDVLGAGTKAFNGGTDYQFLSIENLLGTADHDKLTGSADSNILQGGLGNDTLDGLTGAEDSDWASYSETTTGVTASLTDGSAIGPGTDVLIEIENLLGGTGKDILTGDAEANILDGGLGNDILSGGDGGDTYVVNALQDEVIELGASGTDLVLSAVSIDLRVAEGVVSKVVALGSRLNIENVTLTGTGAASVFGNENANELIGNSVANTLSGGGGNDTLDGMGGADSMAGGAGADTYRVDSTTDKADETGGGGHDEVFSTATFVLTGTGTTAVEDLYLHIEGDSSATTAINGTGNAAANFIEGNNGKNLLVGGGDNDTLLGLNGDDTLDGGDGSDSMEGGDGNDRYLANSANDVAVEASPSGGTDEVHATIAAGQTFTLGTNIENLTLLGLATAHSNGLGNASDNLMVGNAGNNALDGGLGNDTLRGGAGNDTYFIDSPDDVVDETIVGSAGIADQVVVSDFDYTLGTNVEYLAFTGSGGYAGTGNLLNNSIGGGGGDDSLFGEAGNDTLDGFGGIDLTTGGLGNDMHVINDVDDVVVELAGGGIDTVASANLSLDLNNPGFANFENLALLDSYVGTLTGNASANLLTGSDSFLLPGSGDNTLLGGGGNDTLIGLGGNDSLDGGAGIDSMNGGHGDDTYVTDVAGDVIAVDAGGNDTVQAGVGNSGATIYTIAARADLENVELGGNVLNAIGNASANILTGNGLNNSLSGAAGSDTLDGGLGNDTLDGGLGNDSLSGGGGNDFYLVDNADDVIVEVPGGGNDTISTAVNGYTLGADVENLILTGTAVNGTGNTDGNRITAGLGNGVLTGAEGNDTLDGGAGNDQLIGGIGDDVFIFDHADGSVQGGAGSDTVKIATLLGSATAPFDFGLVKDRLDSIERIDITGTGNNAIKVNIDDIAAISGDTHELQIIGNRGPNDTVGDFFKSDDQWEKLGLVELEPNAYYTAYQAVVDTTTYTLYIHTDIVQSFPT